MLPDVLLLDEPELGLHPAAISLIGDMIKSLSKERQIIVATQSPLLVDAFDIGEITVLDLAGRKDGGPQARRSRLSALAGRVHHWRTLAEESPGRAAMIRLAISVEGQTEEEFIKRVLAPHLRESGVEPTPILLGRARGRSVGGGTSESTAVNGDSLSSLDKRCCIVPRRLLWVCGQR